MNEAELKKHLEWLEYEFKNTNIYEREKRGQLIIAMNCAKEQLENN